MRILVYGAGVLGCNLANNLYHAKKDVTLLARGVWAKQLKKNGLKKEQLTLSKDALSLVIRGYTREAGVRNLERKLGEICRKAARQLPEWNVSVSAQAAGLAVYSGQWEKDEYIRQTIRFVRKEKAYLEMELKKLMGDKIAIFQSDANFLLLKTEIPLYVLLLEQGILVRDCENYRGLGRGFYRIAVKGHGDNRILADEINRLL